VQDILGREGLFDGRYFDEPHTAVPAGTPFQAVRCFNIGLPKVMRPLIFKSHLQTFIVSIELQFLPCRPCKPIWFRLGEGLLIAVFKDGPHNTLAFQRALRTPASRVNEVVRIDIPLVRIRATNAYPCPEALPPTWTDDRHNLSSAQSDNFIDRRAGNGRLRWMETPAIKIARDAPIAVMNDFGNRLKERLMIRNAAFP
jgi:hypothetical protein